MFSLIKRHSGFFLLLAGIVGLVVLNVTKADGETSSAVRTTASASSSALPLGNSTGSSAVTTTASTLVVSDYVFVDLHGAVLRPGVYRVRSGTRIGEVIALAGGTISGADLSQINQAQTVRDEMVIVVPWFLSVPDDPSEDSDPVATICVDVKGAVLHPGMVFLPEGARIDDAVKAAGGMTAEADSSSLNLAARLTDGQIVFVPLRTAESAAPEAGWVPGYGYVAVRGEVVRPGLYYVKVSATIREVLELAGGLTWVGSAGNLNLDETVVPGSTITVLTETEVFALLHPTQGGGTSPETPNGTHKTLININTARVEELDTLYGIGPVLAQNIIDYRAENGYFECIEDIMKVTGIKSSIYENIKDDITV
jgi:competence protein ComEA